MSKSGMKHINALARALNQAKPKEPGKMEQWKLDCEAVANALQDLDPKFNWNIFWDCIHGNWTTRDLKYATALKSKGGPNQ
jgi:hypothetical protein